MRARLLLAVLAAVVSVVVLVWPRSGHDSPAPAGRGFAAVVVRPVDGDTLVARSGGRTFYGRLLAYVWLPDGRMAETEQLESGWATTYVYEGRPVSLFDRLAAAARHARDAHRGVWADCGGDFHSASG